MPDDRSKLGFAAIGDLLRNLSSVVTEWAKAEAERRLKKWHAGDSGFSSIAPFAILTLLLAPLACSPERLSTDEGPELPLLDEDLSAVAVVDKYFLLGSDEARHLFVLHHDNFAEALEPIELTSSNDELDIEAIAALGTTLYVAGSHSSARRRADEDRTQEENRNRIAEVRPEHGRNRIYRFELDTATGRAGAIEQISLAALLENDPIIGPFMPIASKENGVDIEGLAVREDALYLGFRSPVLRDNYIPILRIPLGSLQPTFESGGVVVGPLSTKLLFLDLEGRGIRDLVALPSGFLVLAGPPNDAPGEYVLYYWTGEDGLTGTDQPSGVVKKIAVIEAPPDGAAEGMALLRSEDDCHELLIVFDGPPGGAPSSLRACTKA